MLTHRHLQTHTHTHIFSSATAPLCHYAGKTKRWDIVESHPSVGILLYHRDLHAFLLVRQVRVCVGAGAGAQETKQGNCNYFGN